MSCWKAVKRLDDKFKAKSMEIAENHKILLGFGVEADNVLDLIDSSSISGIALKGGDEIKPGYKDFDALADILEAIEVEDY
jgi:phosphoribosylanthranilate isomerase